ncbi:YadA-like family protein [Pseudomonas sp. PDNC002]|uniref:YadA family autotransporter adhesin n=1 Tax=Pseudomonas sp. PDNC002 TaxID=2811422 RepID=UPI0023DD4BC9|nr:YadA-like family protein [Pseudomonas sp. PDNC002]
MSNGVQATDAVNVSQLQGVTQALGTSAAVNTDGTIAAPSYALNKANSIGGTTGAAADVGTAFSKVDGALGSLDTRVSQNTTNIAGNTTSITNLQNNINNGTAGLVQQSSAGATLTVGKDTDGVAVSFADKNSSSRSLTNVSAGVSGTDAVNMSQLNTTNANVDRVEGKADQLGTTAATALGGGASYDSVAGDLSLPSYALDKANSIGGTTGAATNVGSAFGKVDGALGALDTRVSQNTTNIAGNTASITDLQNTVNNIDNGTVGLVQQAGPGATLTVGKDTNGAAVSFADKNGSSRSLTNVSAGVSGTDAVNMSQLNTTNANVDRVEGKADQLGTTAATALGGGASYDSTAGSLSLPSYALDKANSIGGTTGAATNVGSAFGKVDGALGALDTRVSQNTTSIAGNTASITDLQNTVNNIDNGTVGLVQQTSAGAVLTVGKDTDGAAVSFADKNGSSRSLTNVSAGVAGTDAVNMSQLNTTNANVDRVEGKADQLGTTAATALGGGASYNSTAGSLSAPSYALDKANAIGGTVGAASDIGTAFGKVDGALGTLDTRVSQNTSDIDDIQTTISNFDTSKAGLVQQATPGANLTVGAKTDGAAILLADKNGNTRALKNLTAGVDANDAVNMSQLNTTNANVTRVEGKADQLGTTAATALGGGASYDSAAGSLSLPSYALDKANTIGGTTGAASDVGSAFGKVDGALGALDTRVSQNTTDINDLQTTVNDIDNGTVGLVQQASAGANLTVGKDTDGVAVSFADKNGSSRSLTNVSAGVAATDAVNMSQLNTTNANVTRVEGKADQLGTSAAAVLGATYDATNGLIAAPSYALSNANRIDNTSGAATDVGSAFVTVDNALGNLDSRVTQNTTEIIGLDGRVTTIENAVVGGGGVKYLHANSSKADSVASGADSLALGPNAQASAAGSSAVGNDASASGAGAVAMGEGAAASADGSVALGKGSSDGGRGAETYAGAYSGASNTTAGTVSVGNATTGETRTISNVADGKEANDAVNMRQLDGAVAEAKQYTDDSISTLNTNVANNDVRINAAETNISNIQNGTDGMFQVNNTGGYSKPTPTGTNAVAGGSGAVASAANSTAIGTQSKATASNSVALGANSVADRENSVSMGSTGNERQVTNVAAGTSDTDAVNVAQLNESLANISTDHSYTDQRYNELKGDLKEQDDILSAGIAGAMAQAALPQPYVPGASMTAASASNYRGQSALAVGVSRISNDGHWVTKLQGSANTQQDFGVSVGVGYQW